MAVRDLNIDVSVVIPVHNASLWLKEALGSVISQTFSGSVEISIYDDASTDSSMDVMSGIQSLMMSHGITLVVGHSTEGRPQGAGYARNQSIAQSTGKYICLLDADDVMMPDRLSVQYDLCSQHPGALVGSGFIREPRGATDRYTRWSNGINHQQLYTQAFTSFGPTIIQPTWFFSRDLFERHGPFDETGKGSPEDLLFFYKLLSAGVKLLRVDLPLLVYRFHEYSTTSDITEGSIWELRVSAVQELVLSKWTHFTIWSAGRQGRRLYRSLRPENQAKVLCFCDVDAKKISRGFYTYEESPELPRPRVPIIHFTQAVPPLLICVKWDLTHGEFEKNLSSKNFQEGKDYYNFS